MWTDPATNRLIYATDEAVAARAGGDYLALCPEWQKRAAGTDGAFAAGAPWVLTSASNDFLALGAAAGNVVALTAPKAAFAGSGELFAVDAVAPGALALRRVGEPSGAGLPPGAGGLAAVAFKVKTFFAQLRDVSYELDKRYGIDPLLVGSGGPDLYDPKELEQAAVLTLLVRLYGGDSRAKDGDWALKLGMYRQDLLDLLDRVTVKWGAKGVTEPPRTRFSTRLSR